MTIAAVLISSLCYGQLAGWTIKGGYMQSQQSNKMFNADSTGSFGSFSLYGAREMHFGYANSFTAEIGYRNKRLSVADATDVLVLNTAEFSTLSVGLNWKFWFGNFLAVNRLHKQRCADKDHMIYEVTVKPWWVVGINRDFILSHNSFTETLSREHGKGTWDFYAGLGVNLLEIGEYNAKIIYLEARYFQGFGRTFKAEPYTKLRNNGFEILLGFKFSHDAKQAFGWN